MMQQINLYQPIFRKEQKIFSARALLIASLLLLLGLAALYGASYWQGQPLHSQLAQTIEQRDQSRNRVTQLAKEYPAKKTDPQLEGKVEGIKTRLNFLQQVAKTLSSESSGTNGGFSEYLAALSRQDIKQLWLKQITILGGGREIRLHGLTTHSARVPQYIQQLSREAVFQGTSFHRLSMGRQSNPDNDTRLIQFVLETALKSAPKGDQASATGWDVTTPGSTLEGLMR